MAYEEKKYDSDEHFDYAFRQRDQKKIHISEVPPEICIFFWSLCLKA